MRCRIKFMMISGNSLKSKCDHHKLFYLLAKSKHHFLEWYLSLSQFCIFSQWLWFVLQRNLFRIKNIDIKFYCTFWLYRRPKRSIFFKCFKSGAPYFCWHCPGLPWEIKWADSDLTPLIMTVCVLLVRKLRSHIHRFTLIN